MSRRTSGPQDTMFPDSVEVSPNDVVAPPAANMGAVLTFAALNGHRHVISGVSWSYDDDPTGGRLRVLDGADTIYDVDITVGGPGFIPFDPPRAGGLSNAMIIELFPGGAGITGKVNVLGHWTE